jgi:NAD(P)-dependent dehydrogenase (short-subunit alcohol dehydrogenase family)
LYSLKGKQAFITGGTGGIGLEVARNFISFGAIVKITGCRKDGNRVANGIGAKFIRCDATSEQDVKDAFVAAEEGTGPLDILVINAGIADDEGSIEEYDSAQMRRLFEVNLNGVFYALKYGPKHMRDNGSIITSGSASGSGSAYPGAGVYAASKAGVAYLTRTSAMELAPRGIRVNAVCPALIAGTGMMTADDGGPAARYLSRLTAFGRMGRLDEAVGIYNFLAGDGSTFITGQEIRVDGGMTAGLGLPILAALGE